MWGKSACVDLHECDHYMIRTENDIRWFVAALCNRIGMTRWGPCQVVYFGEEERVAGYSMTQFIETSLISGHFVNQTNSAYIDVFSCKDFDPYLVETFARDFFKAKSSNVVWFERH